MTLRQTVQAAPGKTSDLIAKLSETSNQAVKTREGLFAQLSDELSRYVALEVNHFLPLLRKHEETKALVPAALQGNKDLRASLDKLTAMPKETDEFLEELDVLNKSFQQHVRNERKELLPAVLKAFSSAEASDLAANIETAAADAEQAKRDAKREEAAKAKLEEEKAEADAKAERAAAESERDAEKDKEAAKEKRATAKAKREANEADAIKRTASNAQKAIDQTANQAAEKSTEASARAAATIKETGQNVRAGLGEQAQQVVADTQEVMAVVHQTGQTIRDDLAAVGSSSPASAGIATNIFSIWMEYVSNAARANTTSANQLLSCKSMIDVAELQNDFTTSAMRNIMQRNLNLLKVTQQTSEFSMAKLNLRSK